MHCLENGTFVRHKNKGVGVTGSFRLAQDVTKKKGKAKAEVDGVAAENVPKNKKEQPAKEKKSRRKAAKVSLMRNLNVFK